MRENNSILYYIIFMLVNSLIIFFLLLIAYQIILACMSQNNFREGLEDSKEKYKDYNTNDPNNAMILAQQNAGNIEYIKGRIDEIVGLKGIVMDNCGNIVSLNEQMMGLIQQQAELQQDMVGDEPADVSGTN